MAAPEQDLTTKLAMSLEEIINLNQNVGGEAGSASPSGGEGEREGGRPFRRGKRFPRGGGDKPYPRPTGSAAVTNRVYVGNLPWQTSWQDLKDHMRSTGGNVVYADVFLDEYGRSKVCLNLYLRYGVVSCHDTLIPNHISPSSVFLPPELELMQGCGYVVVSFPFVSLERISSHILFLSCHSIVEYATREEALNAIKALNDTKIGDSERLIFVREVSSYWD
jgi:hypothetical protein